MKAYSTRTAGCYLYDPGSVFLLDEGSDPGPGRVFTHHSCATVVRAAADVAAYVLDPRTMPHWSAVIYEVEVPDESGFRTGERLQGRMHIPGVTLAAEGVQMQCVPACVVA